MNLIANKQLHPLLNTKVAAITIATVLCCGIVVENVYLSLLGLYEFSPPRARTLLVGASFLIYALYPVAAPALFYYALRKAMPTKRRSDKSRNFACLVLSFAVSSLVFTSAIHYFISYSFIFADSPISMLYKLPVKLWFGSGSLSLVHFALFWVPMWLISFVSIYNSKIVFFNNDRFRPAIIVLLLLGILSFPLSYAGNIHANVSSSVGGGQPTIIYVCCKGEAIPIVQQMVSLNKIGVWDREQYGYADLENSGLPKASASLVGENVWGPLLLHKSDSEYLYLSEIPGTLPQNITVIPRSEFFWYRTLNARVGFFSNAAIVYPDYNDIAEGSPPPSPNTSD